MWTSVAGMGLTFDMSGGPKGAKRPLERPLDGGVRRRLPGGRCVSGREHAPVCGRTCVRKAHRPVTDPTSSCTRRATNDTAAEDCGEESRRTASNDRARRPHCELAMQRSWGLTFDMSGGPKGAKRPLGRPLDGGVRRLLANARPRHCDQAPLPEDQRSCLQA